MDRSIEQILEAGFAKFAEAQEKSFSLVDEKLASAKEERQAEIADLEKRADGWLAELKKHVLKGSRRYGIEGGDAILEAIPERFKPQLKYAEIVCGAHKRSIDSGRRIVVGKSDVGAPPFVDDPIAKTAAGAWWALQIKKLSKPGSYSVEDREDQAKLANALGGVQRAAMGEGSAGEGEEFVPVVVEAEILRLVSDFSELRPLVRVVPMTTWKHNWPRRLLDISMGVVAEGTAQTDGVAASTYDTGVLEAKKFIGLALTSGELLQDNIVGLVDHLSTEFAEGFGREEDLQALEGDGTGANFTGLSDDAAVNEIDPGGTNGDALSIANLLTMKYTAKQKSSRRGARYFINTTMFSGIVGYRMSAVAAADGEGGYLFQMSGAAGPTPTILGDPVIDHSVISEVRTKAGGTQLTNLYYGPPSGIIFGDRLGIQVDLDPFTKFANFQTQIRAIKRTGIMVGLPKAFTRLINIDVSLAIVK